MNKPCVQITKTSAPPLTIQGHTITPVGQAVVVRWPRGALLWHRPVAVEVGQGTQVQYLPIYDTTWRYMVAWGLVGLVVVALAWLSLWRIRQQSLSWWSG